MNCCNIKFSISRNVVSGHMKLLAWLQFLM